jgi:hypothetical protein
MSLRKFKSVTDMEYENDARWSTIWTCYRSEIEKDALLIVLDAKEISHFANA